MKHLLAALALLILAACNSNVGTDGHEFDPDQAEYKFTDFRVTVTTYPSVQNMRHIAKTEHGVNLPEDRLLYGFAILDNRSADCHIHIVDPAVDYAPEWMGHELMHCIYGRWHPTYHTHD